MVTSVQHSTMVLGDVISLASGNKAEIKSRVKAHAKAFADGLRGQLDALKSQAPKPLRRPPPGRWRN